jgi:hypothetical protein
MSSDQHRHSNHEALLVTIAESIGSTLGTIAAKVSAVPEALAHTSLVQKAEREGKEFVRKSKTVASKLKKANNKFTAVRRRKGRVATTAAKRVVRSASTKRKAARRIRHKK